MSAERREEQGRRWPDGRPVALRAAAGVIERLAPIDGDHAGLPWIAPLLFDPQVNGYAGVDFQSDATTPAQLEAAAESFAADGGGRFLLTLITDEWPRLLERLRRLRAARAASPRLQRRIAGWHIEGPFLSPEPGFRGAHDAAAMRDPTPDDLRALRAVAGDDPLVVTLAPERAGAMDCLRAAPALGIRVWLGHTDASATQLREAFALGAAGITHLGNGCPTLLGRADNILWRALDLAGARASVIPDAIHVSPPLFRILHRLLGAERIVYTTDAMSAAGAPPGRYAIGRTEIEVGDDGIVRLPGGTGAFAGSSLRPLAGVARAAAMLGCGWREAWEGFSSRPAAWAGLDAALAPGNPADYCIIRETPDGPRATVFVDGTERAEHAL